MTVRHRLAGAALAVAFAVGLGACASTVDGSGHAVAPSSQPSGFPTPSQSPAPTPTDSSSPAPPTGSSPSSEPGEHLTCPTITYPHAHLRFDCIDPGLTLGTNAVWPVSLHKTVEKSTGWVLEEGAGNWGAPGSDSMSGIAREVRTQMIGGGGYGKSPKLNVVRDSAARVGGVQARVLQTNITLNRAWAKARGTKVTSEHLWIVVMKVSDSDYTLWYTSIPNFASNLWSKVNAVMDSIRVD